MSRRFDTIVIGLGAMGSAACAHLARAGARVLGIEQFTRGHDRGSSHGGSRVVRWTYFEHPSYMPLLARSRELWAELEELSGESLVHRCGVLYAGDPAGEVIRGVRSTASGHGIELEELSHDVVRRRLPQFSIDAAQTVLLEPGAGFVRPESAIRAHLRVAEGHGAVLHEGERVESMEERVDGVIVESDAETYEAGSVVVTAGAWCGRLIGSLRTTLTPTRQVMAWIDPGARSVDAGASRCPVWFIEDGPSGAFYGVPIAPPPSGQVEAHLPRGLKVARHLPGKRIDPDAPRHPPTAAEVTDLVDAMQRIAPGLAGPSSGSAICMYTMTPDSHFVIDVVPESRRMVLAGGFSGHGFKFAPVIGEILSALALKGRTDHPIEFLRAGRFA